MPRDAYWPASFEVILPPKKKQKNGSCRSSAANKIKTPWAKLLFCSLNFRPKLRFFRRFSCHGSGHNRQTNKIYGSFGGVKLKRQTPFFYRLRDLVTHDLHPQKKFLVLLARFSLPGVIFRATKVGKKSFS